MGIIGDNKALEKYKQVFENKVQSAGFEGYYAVWNDIMNRLNNIERLEFGMYLQLKKIDGELQNLNTEFSKTNIILTNQGEVLPIPDRLFLQVFAEKEQWGEFELNNDSKYFETLKETSEYILSLVHGKASETDIMGNVKRIYKSEKYRILFEELTRRYQQINTKPLVMGLKCDLTREQLGQIFDKLQEAFRGKDAFKASKKSFQVAFSGEEVPAGVPLPVWCLRRGDKLNMKPLRDFLKAIGVRLGTGRTTIDCIIDEKGDPVNIPQYDGKSGSQFSRSIDRIISEIKNISE